MASIIITNFVFDAAGDPVSGAAAQIFAINVDGTIGSQVGSTFNTGATGKYTFSLDTANSPSGMFATKLTSGTDVRWRRGDIEEQMKTAAGTNGVAPLPSASVTAGMLAGGAATDTAIGSRTATQTIGTAFSDTGTLTQLLSWFAKALKATHGETNWHTSPTDGTLSQKIRNAGNVPRITSSITLPVSGSVDSEVYIVTSGSNKGLWQWKGGNWEEIANADIGEGVGGGDTSFGFRHINVGSSIISADSAEDTLTLVAGTNITLTPSTSLDRVTISSTGGGGTNAQTIKNNDADLYPYFQDVNPQSGGAPSLSTGPWRLQAGSFVATFGGSTHAIPIDGPINGYVTVILTDGDYGSHFNDGALIVVVEDLVTGSNPIIAARVRKHDNAIWTGQVRINYFVVHF